MPVPFKLFVGATQANTGKLRVFREHELTIDVLLASACLPKIHRPVQIDGEPYWDGGYSANPAVFPLFYDCDAATCCWCCSLRCCAKARPHGARRSRRASPNWPSAPTSCARCACSPGRGLSEPFVLPWAGSKGGCSRCAFT